MYARSKVESRPFALALISIIASGCAAGISTTPHGRAAGEWSVTLPAAASYSQGLAYGRGGSSANAFADVDALLLADASLPNVASDQTSKKPAPRKRRAEHHMQPASSEPTAPAPAPAPVVPPAGRYERTELALADSAEIGRYEARQAQSQEQQQFRGGDALVIGASTLLLVILIVLLVLLLL